MLKNGLSPLVDRSDLREYPNNPVVALVTGATGLIGRAVCKELSTMGMTVAAAYHWKRDEAERMTGAWARGHGEVVPFACDLAQPESGPGELVETVGERLGKPLVYVGCAGLKLRGTLLMTKPETLKRVTDVNFNANVELVRRVARGMMRARWGRVIVLGSYAGSAGLPGEAAYAATKASLSAWVASAAGELGRFGITVNVVAPGAIEGPDDGLYSEDEIGLAVARIGCGRLGQAEEVAAVIGFLASHRATYVNGATIPVDGGARF